MHGCAPVCWQPHIPMNSNSRSCKVFDVIRDRDSKIHPCCLPLRGPCDSLADGFVTDSFFLHLHTPRLGWNDANFQKQSPFINSRKAYADLRIRSWSKPSLGLHERHKSPQIYALEIEYVVRQPRKMQGHACLFNVSRYCVFSPSYHWHAQTKP